MIKKNIFLSVAIFLFSCSNIELILKEKNPKNILENNVELIFGEVSEDIFLKKMFEVFGNSQNADYILVTSFSERKENVLVKQNQVAEKISYILIVNYELYYKNRNCNVYNKRVTSKFSFVPKSFGYNFGADRSLEKLYNRAIISNIEIFSNSMKISTNCLK